MEEPRIDLAQVIARLKAGEIIAYPTETFYGLGVDPANEDAVEKLLKLKQRFSGEGVSLIASDISAIEALPIREQFKEKRLTLQRKFWPGALTLILDLDSKDLPFSKKLLAADGSIAVRVTSNEVARKLAESLAGFITATSANPHGLAPAKSSIQAQQYFPGIYALLGQSKTVSASTIVDTRQQPYLLVREGAISLKELRPYL